MKRVEVEKARVWKAHWKVDTPEQVMEDRPSKKQSLARPGGSASVVEKRAHGGVFGKWNTAATGQFKLTRFCSSPFRTRSRVKDRVLRCPLSFECGNG